jgi:hypothetical protein
MNSPCSLWLTTEVREFSRSRVLFIRTYAETGFLNQQSRLSALVPEPETRFISQLCGSPVYNKRGGEY